MTIKLKLAFKYQFSLSNFSARRFLNGEGVNLIFHSKPPSITKFLDKPYAPRSAIIFCVNSEFVSANFSTMLK